jgi:enterochelin esterase-like enzyme
MKKGKYLLVLAGILLLISSNAHAGGTVTDQRFFCKSLNREMSCRVYLPSAYDPNNPDKRFPVIYFLHGASLGYEAYDALYSILDNLIAIGLIKPVITVMPDGLAPPYNGSFYTNSELYGNYEDYISHDLVEFMDSAFNTLAERGKRGIMGASMGAYGALKAAFKHPEQYIGVVGHSGPVNTAMLDIFINDLITEDGGTAPFHWSPGPGKSLTNLTFSMAGAFSPNLTDPYLVDFPLDSMAIPIPSVMERWQKENICEIAKANPPGMTMGINFDCGNADQYHLHYQNRSFSDTLTKYNIPHRYEEYSGTHTNGLPVRVTLSLIYFDVLFKTDFTSVGWIPNEPTWKVYPNPANRSLTVSSDQATLIPDNQLIQLMDNQGRVVRDQTLADGINVIDLTGLPSGIYYYKIKNGSRLQTGKTIILRQ